MHSEPVDATSKYQDSLPVSSDDILEFLNELDIEYRELADALGLTVYVRVPAIGIHPAFIEGLAEAVRQVRADEGPDPFGGANGARLCPAIFGKCPCSRLAVGASQ